MASLACSVVSAGDGGARGGLGSRQLRFDSSNLKFRHADRRHGLHGIPESRPGGAFRLVRFPGRLIRLGDTGGGQRAIARLRQQQSRMGNLHRRHIGRRHDHPQAHPGHVEQLRCEVEGHPHAAMRRRIPRQLAAVQSDARPGDALHVRHEGIVIDIRVVVRLFLDDAEYPGRVSRVPSGRSTPAPGGSSHWRHRR